MTKQNMVTEAQSHFESDTGINKETFYEPEGHAVPIPLIIEAISYLSYGSKLSRALKLCFITGCRLAEVNRMKLGCKSNNYILWRPGKNQFGRTREEYLPPELWREIEYGMARDKHSDDLICDLQGKSILRYFNRDIRPNLSSAWQEKVPTITHKNNTLKVRYEYKYQLKGFRKTFSTLLFTYFWQKYKNSKIALEKTSSRMKHSSAWMTESHYIDMSIQINACEYLHRLPFEYLKAGSQETLGEFMHLPLHLKPRQSED